MKKRNKLVAVAERNHREEYDKRKAKTDSLVAVAERAHKEKYEKRKTLLREAGVEQRAIRDCKKKIDYLLAKDPEADTSFPEKALQNHRDRYEKIIQEVSYMELDVFTEKSSQVLNSFA